MMKRINAKRLWLMEEGFVWNFTAFVIWVPLPRPVFVFRVGGSRFSFLGDQAIAPEPSQLWPFAPVPCARRGVRENMQVSHLNLVVVHR